MNAYHVAVAGLGLAVVGLGGALAFALNDSNGWMHGGNHGDDAGMPMMGGMAGMSMMDGSNHAGRGAEMRAILGDDAYNRMIEYMRSMDGGDGHMAMMMSHMEMDTSSPSLRGDR